MAGKSFVFRFADIEVREREFTVVKAGEVLPVEPKAFRVLLILLRNPQKLISKEELLNAVWGDAAVTENSLTRSIALLRRLLGDETRSPRYIETVATVGYRFLYKVEVAEEPPGAEEALVLSGAKEPGSPEGFVGSTPGAMPRVRRRRTWAVAAGVLVASCIALGWWQWWFTPAVPHVTSIEAITHDGIGKILPVTDGSRSISQNS